MHEARLYRLERIGTRQGVTHASPELFNLYRPYASHPERQHRVLEV